ncbi:MAG TPA: hypothetical protein VN181_09505 [Thermoanaerobaculia bacterium]|nr:hypothetical protein [Thermoanaerobaculia bacterium]
MANFTGKIVSDAKNPPEVRVLEGWLGTSSEDGFVRLYTNFELSAWLDIPKDAVLHTEDVPDSLPAGAVLIWVRADAQLKPGGHAFSKALPFLQGELAKAPEAQAAAKAAPRPGGLPQGFCITYAPICSEVTGFTGQCSYEPQPKQCATYPPMCLDVTGFTGHCSFEPAPQCPTYRPMCVDITGFTGRCSFEPGPGQCATYRPVCLEVTGFTGHCSFEPGPGTGTQCPTYRPMCSEVTGFTGRCSFEPSNSFDQQSQQCITYRPRCSEVTGFTGRCSYQPR